MKKESGHVRLVEDVYTLIICSSKEIADDLSIFETIIGVCHEQAPPITTQDEAAKEAVSNYYTLLSLSLL